jgi:hypothetical protein
MIDSIDRYYQYTIVYHSLLEEVGRFIITMAKNSKNYTNFLNFSFEQLIDTICTNGSMAISQRSLL